MTVYVDTSALFALLVRDDRMHERARQGFDRLAAANARLVTSSFVLVETLTLLRRRVGMEAVVDFQLRIQPLLDVVWVDQDWYDRALTRCIAQSRKEMSLVDHLGFEIMEAKGLTAAFAFDRHFEQAGFTLV